MVRRKELGLGTHAWGEASVLAAGVHLLYQGYTVHKPLVDDDGVDLSILKGTKAARIQVKCSSRLDKKKHGGTVSCYEFTLAAVRASSNGIETRLRKFSDQVEFVILHGVDEDKYWIVPSAMLDGKKSVIIYSTSRSKLDIDWESIKVRREAGETFQSLGDSVGLSASAVLERLRGTTKDAGTFMANQLRACENAWHLIDEFFETSSASGVEPPKDNEGQ